MPVIRVGGQKWNVVSVDGNVVTLAGGGTIKVNDSTLAEVHEATEGPHDTMAPVTRKRRRKAT